MVRHELQWNGGSTEENPPFWGLFLVLGERTSCFVQPQKHTGCRIVCMVSLFRGSLWWRHTHEARRLELWQALQSSNPGLQLIFSASPLFPTSSKFWENRHVLYVSLHHPHLLPRILLLLHNLLAQGSASATWTDICILRHRFWKRWEGHNSGLIYLLRKLYTSKNASRWPSDSSLCVMKNNVNMLSDSGKACACSCFLPQTFQSFLVALRRSKLDRAL